MTKWALNGRVSGILNGLIQTRTAIRLIDFLLPGMRSLTFALVIIGALITAVGWWVYQQGIVVHEDETPVVQFAQEPELEPLEVLVIEQLAATVRVISCARGVCQTEAPAPAAAAVTDGTWWYFYEQRQNERGGSATVLIRRHSETGEEEEVMRETPLTSPRELFMSPHGDRLAFFLDNINEPGEQLTELWVFDANQGGVRLVAEKLFVPDIRTQVRWNAVGSHLWFIADNGEQEEATDELEAVIVDVDSPGAVVTLAGVDWKQRLERMTGGPSDIRLPDAAVALISSSLLRQPVLEVVSDDKIDRTTVRGTVPYLQWLQDDSLLYVVQDRAGFTFWRRANDTHRFVARRPGFLQSAHTTSGDEYVSFAVRGELNAAPRVLSLHINSGRVGEEALLNPSQAPLHVVQSRLLVDTNGGPDAAVTTTLDDAEMAAVLDEHLDTIAGEPVSPQRFTTTDSPNTVFVEFETESGARRRVLVTIRDAIFVEWIIRARYEPVNTTWRKVEGGGLADPAPVRRYEWEGDLNQWVLKDTLAI